MKQPEYHDLTLIGVQPHSLTGDGRQRKRRRLLAHLEQSRGKDQMSRKNRDQQRKECDPYFVHNVLLLLNVQCSMLNF